MLAFSYAWQVIKIQIFTRVFYYFIVVEVINQTREGVLRYPNTEK